MDDNYEMMKNHESGHDSGMEANLKERTISIKNIDSHGTGMKTVILCTIKIDRHGTSYTTVLRTIIIITIPLTLNINRLPSLSIWSVNTKFEKPRSKFFAISYPQELLAMLRTDGSPNGQTDNAIA